MTQLTPNQQSFVDSQVAAGAYSSSTDVVDAALHLLQQRHREYDQLTTAITQINRGEVAELDIADIKARGRQRLSDG